MSNKKWKIDKENEPNFYSDNDIMTYDDIINEIVDEGFKDKRPGNKFHSKQIEDQFFSEYFKNNAKKYKKD